jgi:hypothetical protein
MAAFFLWCILFVLCSPLALLALVLYPIVWLLLLPFRILGIAVHGVLALVWAVVMLPVRLLSAPFRLASPAVEKTPAIGNLLHLSPHQNPVIPSGANDSQKRIIRAVEGPCVRPASPKLLARSRSLGFARDDRARNGNDEGKKRVPPLCPPTNVLCCLNLLRATLCCSPEKSHQFLTRDANVEAELGVHVVAVCLSGKCCVCRRAG